MITDSYDITTEPIIRLADFYGEQKHIVDTCLIVLSCVISDYLHENFECEKIGEIGACNGNIPIFTFTQGGKRIAFYLSPIGSTLAAHSCIEANWLCGATNFIMFGSCGSLDRGLTDGKFIIPTEAYRDEGMSYHYALPADYIKIKNAEKLSAIFEKLGIPYVKAKVWTTDAMLRETRGMLAKRLSEGCAAVEMELAGVQAVCDFHGFELYDFLAAGDVLSEEVYSNSGLHRANHDTDKLFIALEIAKHI